MDAAANELYVADGYGNHRVIVFDAGTGAYKRHWGANGRSPGEFVVVPDTRGSGSAWDLDFSRDRLKTYLYTADGENNHIWLLARETGKVLSRFGRNGRYAGQLTGSTTWPSMPRATSTRRRSTTANECRNSCTRASRRWGSRASRPAKISVQNLR